MKDKTKKLDNALIAEFMGATIEKHEMSQSMCYKFEKSPTEHSSYYWSAEAMEYHIRWDWLMPVVEKIEALQEMDGNRIITKWVHILGKGCIIEMDNIKDKEIAICHTHDSPMTKLQATYTAVLLFIESYNDGK